MSRIYEPTDDQLSDYGDWVDSRPQAVREVATRLNPWTLYRMKSTGHRVTLRSFGESPSGVTVTVRVSGEYNRVEFERDVFGIDPDDLVECDLPGADEPLGATLTQEQVDENIGEIRLRVRPDLWMKMPDGSVVLRGQN